MSVVRTYREEGIAVVCPRCQAAPHTPCIGSRNQPRFSLHEARHLLAVELGAPRIRPFPVREAMARRSVELTHG